MIYGSYNMLGADEKEACSSSSVLAKDNRKNNVTNDVLEFEAGNNDIPMHQ